jgi:CO/xanthine dehydrogenase Mo-binding subunit
MTSTLVNSSPRDISDMDGSLLAQGPYRALPEIADTFARESHIDELAYVAGVDPVDFRLGLLDDARLAAVTEAAARRFGWRFFSCPAGRPALWAKGWLRCGAGIAAGLEQGRRVATCVEVRPDGIGQFRVTRIVTAYECGAVADRAAVISQIQGGIVMAAGGALSGPGASDCGSTGGRSLSGYQVPTAADPLEVDVVLLDRPDLPSAGVGGTPLIALAPAIANAIFAVTGRRCVR